MATHVVSTDQFGGTLPDPETAGKTPVQLPMFMKAKDLMGSLTMTADSPHMSVEEVMDYKLDEALDPKAFHGGGVHASVEQQGVLNPVQMIHGRHNIMMGQGHHRVASAAEIAGRTGRDMWVPVVHTDAREHAHLITGNSRMQALGDYHEWAQHTDAHSHSHNLGRR